MTGLNDTMRNAGKIEIIHDVIAGHNDVIGFRFLDRQLSNRGSKFYLGCNQTWCPSNTQIGTEWFPWTTGNSTDLESVVNSDGNVHTLFILFSIQGTN